MTPVERTAWICERAREAGFDLCGVAEPDALAELAHFPEWLERGYAGEMNYLHDSRREDPRRVLEGARSLIVAALNYNSAQLHSTEFAATGDGESPCGRISRYAWGDDYHKVLGRKLENLLAAMRAQIAEPFEARAYVDSGPVAERVAAKYAGLGWLAKNTCLINEELGSWLFLGVILTTLELASTLPRGEPPPADLCGNCTLCLDACPTQAFAAPYVLDARRCISYLTIELRGAIPGELREDIGDAVFGCDICQDVCPWNRKAAATAAKEFMPRAFHKGRTRKRDTQKSAGETAEANDQLLDLQKPDREPSTLSAPGLEWLAGLSREAFSDAFRGSAVKRAKWRGIVRNACVALGNARLQPHSPAHSRVMAMLDSLARSEDDLIAEHANWALEQLTKNGNGNS
jgi:epoxyqueuosine reductase